MASVVMDTPVAGIAGEQGGRRFGRPDTVEAQAAAAREDRVAALVAEAKALAGHIAAAQSRLVSVVTQVMAISADPGWGFRSEAHRWGFELGLVPAEAHKLVAVAERLDELPVLADAFAARSPGHRRWRRSGRWRR